MPIVGTDVLEDSTKVEATVSSYSAKNTEGQPLPRTLKTPYALRPARKIKRGGNAASRQLLKKLSEGTAKVPSVAADQVRELLMEASRVLNGTAKSKKGISGSGRLKKTVIADDPSVKSIAGMVSWISHVILLNFFISKYASICSYREKLDNIELDTFPSDICFCGCSDLSI